MIKFFRKIKQTLLSEGKTEKYFKYAIGEIILVVIGILIALSINNWNESRKEYTTAKILANSLIKDFEDDVDFLNDAIAFSYQKRANCDELLSILKTPVESWNNSLFYEKMNIIVQSTTFFPTNGTYEQIVSTGYLKYFDQSISSNLNAYNMNMRKVLYWADAEDKTFWLMTDILWKVINVQTLSEIREGECPIKNPLYIRIKDVSIYELSNYVAAIKTYRNETLIEYKKQRNLANDIIVSLEAEYKINNERLTKAKFHGCCRAD